MNNEIDKIESLKLIESMKIEDLQQMVYHLRLATYMFCNDEELNDLRKEEWFEEEVIYDREKNVFLLPTKRFLKIK